MRVMRPGLLFIGLFGLLIAVYLLLAETLGNVLTFLLQAAIVIALIVAVTWFRRQRHLQRWSLFADEEDSTPNDHSRDEPASLKNAS